MGSVDSRRFDVKSIAIIGAGASGLAAAKQILGQECFEDVVIFEQQAEVGGVWNYSEHKNAAKNQRIPSVDPHGPPNEPTRLGGGVAPIFPTPMYRLKTNLPKRVMEFSDLSFPADGPLYMVDPVVQQYLITYSQEIRHLIQFSTQVKDVRLFKEHGKDRWEVLAVSTIDGTLSRGTFDAVVVANGHFSTPYLPDIKSIREFNDAYPGVIVHSMFFTSAEPYAGKKIIMVGKSSSCLDIAPRVSAIAQKPMLLSVTQDTPISPALVEFAGCEEVPVIEEFLVEKRGVRFQDGRIEENIDGIIFATGYLYAFPFLESMTPPLVTDGRRVFGLWRDLIHIEHPTLVFPGIAMRVSPLPLVESQAAIFARVWANVLDLPSILEMKQWEEEEAKTRPKVFHTYPHGGDIDLINQNYDWIMRSGSKGKTPPRWDGEVCWQRRHSIEQWMKFKKSDQTATSMEELGFHYKPEENE